MISAAVLLTCLLQLSYYLVALRQIMSQSHSMHGFLRSSARKILNTVLIVVLPCLYIVTVLVWKQHSALRLSDKAARVLTVPWTSPAMSFDEKSGRFSARLEELTAEVDSSDTINDYGILLLVILGLRLLKATDAHPRVGILVTTIANSMEDLLHFAFLTFIIYMYAACIAFAAFGKSLDHFRSLSRTVETLVTLTLGSWPNEALADIKVAIFVVAFLIINFFVLLNFVIAIIVDGFARAKSDIEDEDSTVGSGSAAAPRTSLKGSA